MPKQTHPNAAKILWSSSQAHNPSLQVIPAMFRLYFLSQMYHSHRKKTLAGVCEVKKTDNPTDVGTQHQTTCTLQVPLQEVWVKLVNSIAQTVTGQLNTGILVWVRKNKQVNQRRFFLVPRRCPAPGRQWPAVRAYANINTIVPGGASNLSDQIFEFLGWF